MATSNGIGKIQEELAVTNKRIDNLETAVERSNARIEELVERGFADLRNDMARLISALEKKTTRLPRTSATIHSTSLD